MWVLHSIFSFLISVDSDALDKGYYGTHISRLSEFHHSVSGDVFAVDSRTLFIKGFNYDGEGPGISDDFIYLKSLAHNFPLNSCILLRWQFKSTK
jgi:hypothetical protein